MLPLIVKYTDCWLSTLTASVEVIFWEYSINQKLSSWITCFSQSIGFTGLLAKGNWMNSEDHQGECWETGSAAAEFNYMQVIKPMGLLYQRTQSILNQRSIISYPFWIQIAYKFSLLVLKVFKDCHLLTRSERFFYCAHIKTSFP